MLRLGCKVKRRIRPDKAAAAAEGPPCGMPARKSKWVKSAVVPVLKLRVAPVFWTCGSMAVALVSPSTARKAKPVVSIGLPFSSVTCNTIGVFGAGRSARLEKLNSKRTLTGYSPAVAFCGRSNAVPGAVRAAINSSGAGEVGVVPAWLRIWNTTDCPSGFEVREISVSSGLLLRRLVRISSKYSAPDSLGSGSSFAVMVMRAAVCLAGMLKPVKTGLSATRSAEVMVRPGWVISKS